MSKSHETRGTRLSMVVKLVAMVFSFVLLMAVIQWSKLVYSRFLNLKLKSSSAEKHFVYVYELPER